MSFFDADFLSLDGDGLRWPESGALRLEALLPGGEALRSDVGIDTEIGV